MLIGNLTRDPELRYTPQGTAVATFGLATNRGWTTDTGEKKEEVEFHRLVSWNKLAELCSQLLYKGVKVYIEGRLQTRTFTGSDNAQHSVTEIVVSDMVILSPKRGIEESVGSSTSVSTSGPGETENAPATPAPAVEETKKGKTAPKGKTAKKEGTETEEAVAEEKVDVDEIPF